MDGNRGAKGSIKDRLISMLYRLRYKKKKLKEEDYKIPKKQKQVNYLNNLQKFKETENLDVLDKKDINTLEKVKLAVQFKVGIDEDTKEISSIEQNSNKKIEIKNINEVNNQPIQTSSTKNFIETKKASSNKIKTNSVNKVEKEESHIISTVNEVTYVPKKVGIQPKYEQLDIKLANIESKTDELTFPIDLKKEVKKTTAEIVILKEVNDFVLKSKEDISDIKKDVENLKNDVKDKNKDSKELEEKFNKLKEKIDKLKAKYNAIKEKYDFSEFYIFESIKLMDGIEDFKSTASLNEMDMMINICKDEINKIDSIVILEQSKKEVGSLVDNEKKDQKDVKIKFIKSKENVKNISNIEETIYNELKMQEQIINEMYDEASYLKKEVTRQVEKIGHRRILSSILNISFGILTLPFNGKNLFGIALGETMINKGLKEMNRKIETHEKIKVSYKYKDISDSIRAVKDKVEYINLVISDSLNEINKLKENFKNQYSQYENLLEEYDIVLEKIQTLENTLLTEQNKINSMNRKLNKEDEMNKQKLKRVEDYKK